MKELIIIALSMVVGASSYANVGTNVSADAETMEAAVSNGVSNYPNVVILNQNSSKNKNDSEADADALSTSNAQNLPTTYVEASPLTESRAEQMRGLRQNAEIQTEQRIVEKLEASRLEDERRRANALFGDRFKDLNRKKEVKKEVQVEKTVHVIKHVEPAPAPVVVAAPAQVSTYVDPTPAPAEKRYYFSAQVGSLSYDADNVDTEYSLGGAFGIEMSSNVSVEIGLNYSDHLISESYSRYTEMNQYNLSGLAKYSFLSSDSSLRPYVGGLLSYTRRNYSELNTRYNNRYSSYSQDEEISTNSVDWGAAVGLDFKVDRNFVIGADFRFMSNLVNKDNPEYLYIHDNESPVEDVDYSTISVTAKIRF